MNLAKAYNSSELESLLDANALSIQIKNLTQFLLYQILLMDL